MKLSDLNRVLEEKFPKAYACEWDNDGLMCASDMNAEVVKVLCTLDVTKEALVYAKAHRFDTVISHHPMIFKHLNSITPENHIAEKAIFALKNNINVFSFHTRFDTMPGGMNDLLAERFKLENVRAFSDGESATGRIGELKNEIATEAFCREVKERLGCDKLAYSQAKDTVKTVAILGGAGKDFIKAAIKEGADILISGELSHSYMTDAKEMGISLIEAGHFHTEDIACKYFADFLDSLGIENEYFCSYNITSI